MGFPVLEWQDPEIALDVARSAPSRRGVLGFLSVGFVAAIVLTMRRRPGLKVQDVGRQVAVRREDRVRLVQMDAERDS